MDLSPEDDRVAIGCRDGTVHVWDVQSGAKLADLRGHKKQVAQVAFSPSGDLLVSSGLDWTCRLHRRRRPEWWWGVFWLWELWLTAAFAAVFIRSVIRDRRSFAAER